MTKIWLKAPDPNGECCDCQTGPCDDCTTPARPTQCYLYLPPPDTDEFITSPTNPKSYVDLATALSWLVHVATCFGFAWINGGYTIDVFTASFAANTANLNVQTTGGPGAASVAFAGLNIPQNTTVTFAWVVSGLASNVGITVAVYTNDGTLVAIRNITGATASSVSITFNPSTPPTRAYVIRLQATDSAGTSNTAAWSISADDTMSVNPAIAYWDDAGTIRQIEACPRMQLPPLVEADPLSAYATQTLAQAALDNQTSNCVGYIDTASFALFTATDGGSSLELLGRVNNAVINPTFDMWGSVNLDSTDVLSIAYTTTNAHGAAAIEASLYIISVPGAYDSTATLLETVNSTLSNDTLVFSSVPAQGRYIVVVTAARTDGVATDALTGDFTLTSSGTLTANQIVALYRNGSNCPRQLTCVP